MPSLPIFAVVLPFVATTATAQFNQRDTADLAGIVSQHERRLTHLESDVATLQGHGGHAGHSPTIADVPTPASAATVIYRIKPGESLGQIAGRNGISAHDLARINSISNPNHISAGQLIQIPNQNRAVAGSDHHGGSTAPISDPHNSPNAPIPTLPNDHTVRKGDTLYRIASQHGISIAALRDANGLFTDHISQGQRLRIPSSSQPLEPTSHVSHQPQPLPTENSVYTTHRVAPRETASAIARRYGISVDELTRANNLANPGQINVGQSLVIPALQSPHLGGHTPAAEPRDDTFANYRVRSGNTITSIAREFQVSPQAILDANNLPQDGSIRVGQDLRIPLDQFWATLSTP